MNRTPNEKDKEVLLQEIKIKENEIKNLQRKYEMLNSEYEHQKQISNNNENLIQFYKNQVNASNHNTIDKENENDSKIRELELNIISLEEYQNELELNNENLLKENESLKEEKEELLDLKEKMLNMLTEKEIENSELKTQITEMENASKDITSHKEYIHLEEQFHEYKLTADSNYQDLYDKYEQSLSTEKELKQQIEDIEYENSKLKESLENLEQDYNYLHMQNQQNTNHSNVNDLLQEIEQLQNQNKELCEFKDNLLMKRDTEQKEAKNEIIEIENACYQLQNEKSALLKEIDTIKQKSFDDMQVFQNKSKDDLMQKENMIKTLNVQLDKKVKENSFLEKELRDNKNVIEQLQHEQNELKNDNAVIKETYARDKQEIITKYSIELNAMNMRLKEQNTKIEELMHKINIIKTQTDYTSNNNEVVLGNLLNDSSITYSSKPTYIELENILEDKEQQLKKKMQQEKYYENMINELRNQIANVSDYESLKAEVSCLSKNNEVLNKQINMYKEKLNEEEKIYSTEIKEMNDEVIKTKCLLANITYDKDNEILKLKKHIKKYQDKLHELGFTAVPRKK